MTVLILALDGRQIIRATLRPALPFPTSRKDHRYHRTTLLRDSLDRRGRVTANSHRPCRAPAIL
jgi:hypothetical protein